MNWYTSDLHLFHKKVMIFGPRDYFLSFNERSKVFDRYPMGHDDVNELASEVSDESLERMTTGIAGRINERVAKRDTLFILGDLAFNYTKNWKRLSLWLRDAVKCKDIRILPGNHDMTGAWQPKPKMVQAIQEGRATLIPHEKVIKDEGRLIHLSHFPMACWEKSHNPHHKSINLHGHRHGKPINDDVIRLRYDVSCDAHCCYPVSLKMILEQFDMRIGTEVYD